RYVEEGFDRTNLMLDFFEKEVAKHSDIIEIAYDLDDIRRIAGEGKISAILSIEGGEALMGKIENLDHFYNRGVRILAPVWNRENELGFGQATGSTQGLKPFGLECIKRMDELGMILDVSHLNESGFWDAHSASGRPYMASHSNAYEVMPHERNLRDDQIIAITGRGGIIGFNMFPQIVAPDEKADINDVMAHFRHFIRLGAEKHIGLGCDFDGIPSMPTGITDVSSLKMFKELLTDEFGTEISKGIMESNFYEFFIRYFEG
ncbi:MAG: dipeptidase, partial [Oscillospiraceae bacterium]|nr:dipeptidase [Oscillospiraceae bacterium]